MTGVKWNKLIAVSKDRVSRYLRDTTATIAVAFALMAPVIIGSAGMALDFAHAYLVQQRLAQALDAAALAGAASSADAVEIEQKIQQFFDANYPDSKLGITFDPVVQVIGNEIRVSGNAHYDTFFLGLIGITEIEVGADTTVMREVQGIEVVMVLDNTGSMGTNNNILKLKEASKSFVEILFDRATNPNFVRIGLVPYANSVRVGSYGLGLNPDGTTYADGVPFVSLPTGVTYTTTHASTNWYGCVVEHKATGYTTAATHVSGSKGQLWNDGTGGMDGHGWNPAVTTNDPYPDDVLDEYEGPWDPYMYGRLVSSGQQCSSYSGFSNSRCSSCTGASSSCSTAYCYCWKSASSNGTNESCPHANLVPLTSDEEKLLEAIGDPTLTTSGMRAHGYTLGNIGMAWGARVLSPEFPFEEAHPWDDVYWKKAVVMMTDGENTNESTYSSFWFKNKRTLDTTDYNERFKETCQALKDKDVVIYTITFTDSLGAESKQDYEDCASTPDKYYHVSDPDDLLPLFEQIARELSSLHIVD